VIIFAAPEIQGSIAGDEVSVRSVSFASQPEQIVFLRHMIDVYRSHHAIVQRARDVVFRQYCCEPRDQKAHAIALAEWVQRHITYVNELPERFQTPPTTISLGYGDCDDFTTLIGSLCEAIGIPVEIVGMSWRSRPGGRDDFKHIAPRALVRGPAGPEKVWLEATTPIPVRELPDPIRTALAEGARELRIFVQ
jgi:transglutaminase-like putative cysteine protease